MNEHPNDPLHGLTLQVILERLVERYGWERMGRAVDIRCFTQDPSIKSSLTFLRRTPWARAKVEALYLRALEESPQGGHAPEDDAPRGDEE